MRVVLASRNAHKLDELRRILGESVPGLELVGDLARAGLARLAISIDGPNAEIHDSFRGMAGGLASERRPDRRVMQSTLRPLAVMTSDMAARFAAVRVRPNTVTMCRLRPCMPTQRS